MLILTVGPSPPKLELLVAGAAVEEVRAGEWVLASCQARGGNPVPDIGLLMAGQPAASKDFRQFKNTFNFQAGEELHGQTIACTASNKISQARAERVLTVLSKLEQNYPDNLIVVLPCPFVMCCLLTCLLVSIVPRRLQMLHYPAPANSCPVPRPARLPGDVRPRHGAAADQRHLQLRGAGRTPRPRHQVDRGRRPGPGGGAGRGRVHAEPGDRGPRGRDDRGVPGREHRGRHQRGHQRQHGVPPPHSQDTGDTTD